MNKQFDPNLEKSGIHFRHIEFNSNEIHEESNNKYLIMFLYQQQKLYSPVTGAYYERINNVIKFNS